MNRQHVLWGLGAAAAVVGLWWWSRQPKPATSDPTALLVGTAGLTPIIDDLSDGSATSGTTAKAIV
jgi:hypothetical protein